MKWRKIYREAFIVWIAGITVASVIPSPETQLEVSDKFLHFAVYFITTLFCYLAVKRTGAYPLLMSGGAVLLYSTALEVVQSFLPYRDFSLWDIAANALGIASFILIWIIVLQVRSKTGK